MLHILLLILKIIGIILAVILGILLLIVACILFVPVRYKVSADFHGKPIAKVKVSWLLKIIRFTLNYDSELNYKLSVLFFEIFPGKDKENKISKKNETLTQTVWDDDSSKDNSSDENVVEESFVKEKSINEKEILPKEESVNEKEILPKEESVNEKEILPEEELVNEKEIFSEEEIIDEKDLLEQNDQTEKYLNASENDSFDTSEKNEKESDTKENISGKIKKVLNYIIDKIKLFFITIKKSLCDIKQKVLNSIEKAENKKEKLKEMLEDEENYKLISFLYDNILKLIKCIKPRKYKVNIRYGLGSYEATGWVAVRLAVIYGLLGIDVEIVPDFENLVFEGEVFFKGRIFMISILIIGLKVYFNDLVKKKIINKNK